ncbi:MAG: AAA family ATPase [Chloroflexi bacterium]|nr:AAA family ATPase [Chloroflexota bacterium]
MKSAPSSVDELQLGPLVSVSGGEFEIRGRSFARRRLREPAQRDSRSSASAQAWSNIDSDLAGSMARINEVFLHITTSMADVLERMADISANDRVPTFILLTGPTGCGKTTMAKTFCYVAGEPFVELNFSGDTTLADFFRRTEVEAGEGGQSTISALGPAAEAMLVGKILIINEINMLPPDLLSVLTQAMDTGRIVLSGLETGNVEVELHENFGIIATANPDYIGTMEIGRSLQRRFGLGLGNVPMTFLPPKEEAEALKFEFDRQRIFADLGLKANPTICERMVALADVLRTHEEIGGQMRDRVSTRTLVHWLSLARISGMPLAEVGERAVLTIAPPEMQKQTFQMTRASLGTVRASTAYGDAFNRALLPPDLPDSGEAVPLPGSMQLEPISRPPETHEGDETEEIRLSDGSAAHIVWRVGSPPEFSAAGPDGERIVDAVALADVRRRLREEHGLNFPTPLGSVPSSRAALPCLTRSSWSAIRLAQGALLAGYPVFLRGPTGCGKSAIARTIARLWSLRAVEFSFTGETAKGDLTAVRQLQGGATRWSIQAFMQAVRDGLFVIINEYNMAYPDVHSIINGLFDKGGLVTLPDGSAIRAHPDFRMIATGYADGPGVKPLNEGVENRFGAVVAIDYPPPSEETAILEYLGGDRISRECTSGMIQLAAVSREILAGTTDAGFDGSLSNIPADLAATVAERTALTTAEMAAMVQGSRSSGELTGWYRRGALEGAPPEIQRVLEPVLINYGLGMGPS